MPPPPSAPRAPSPGDDATPFIIRCYICIAPFRPAMDFDHVNRPLDQEFKIYVWRTTTLRDILRHLHSTPRNSHVEPSLLKATDSPLSLVLASGPDARHAFRLVYYDSHLRAWKAREIARDVCRISRDDRTRIEKEAQDLINAEKPREITDDSTTRRNESDEGKDNMETDGDAQEKGSSSPATKEKEAGATPSSPRILPRPSAASRAMADDERAARQTLGSLDMREGDILDIVVLPDGVSMGPAMARGPGAEWAARVGVAPGGAGGGPRSQQRGGQRGKDLFPVSGSRPSDRLRSEVLQTGRADTAGKWGHVQDERRGVERNRGDRDARRERMRSRSPAREKRRSRSPVRERRRSRTPERLRR